MLHPEGNLDPTQSIPLRADGDGVARFHAVRPTLPNSVDRLALDCTDSTGNTSTYSVDLRSDETFASRPFDPSRAALAFRPALTGNPLSFTQRQLIQAGYGPRPDPAGNPDGYRRWLAAVSVPAYKLRSAPRPSSGSIQSYSVNRQPRVRGPIPKDQTVSATPGNSGWTGALLEGSYHNNPTSVPTSYVSNEATWVVPKVTPGGFGTGATVMTIWNGLDNVFQAIVDVSATATHQRFGIHRQCFYADLPKNVSIDEEGTDFTPSPGDTIYAEEWYCDAKGNLNLSGGYGCTMMTDYPADRNKPTVVWECDQAKSSDCRSYPLNPSALADGLLGQTAEFIIEDDTSENKSVCPSKLVCSDEWIDFSPVTMYGSAFVAQGNGVSGIGTWVTTNSDPFVDLLTDSYASVPFERGDGHLIITIPPWDGSYSPGDYSPTGAVTWTEVQNNIYYWNGSNFNSFSTPQLAVEGAAPNPPGVIFGCATSIGVGPNSRGLLNGTPWSTGCHKAADGNYDVWQMQTGGEWVLMQSDIATQIAVSPEGDGGVAWVINAAGDILYWNGSEFIKNAADGCATSIAVGPGASSNGTPWITGCSADAAGNHSVYRMDGSTWVKVQDDVATQVAISSDGYAWAINAAGEILYLDGSDFVQNPEKGCATSIAVGPILGGFTNGGPWITGCSAAADGNHDIYQMQPGGKWVNRQDDVGTKIAVSPAGNAWVISTLKK